MSQQQDMLSFPEQNNPDPIEVADEWLVYLYSGQASDAGKAAFRAWLADSPAHVQAYKNAEQLWRDMGLGALSLADVDEPQSDIPATVISTQIQQKNSGPRRKWLFALAASMLLTVSTAMWWFGQDSNPSSTQYVSHTAEVRTITLADKSTVVLSADSSLTVSFSEHARHLNLLRGRAYFEVSPDPSRPFIVSAGNATATAVGTAFDVNSNDEGITVSVTHGIVDVKSYLDGQSEHYLNMTQITAGQLVQANKHGAISTVQAFDINEALAWRSGRLVYQGQKLSVITAEINRYRSKKIRLVDKALQDKRITLSVAADKTEQVIAAIQATEAVHIMDTPTEILISKASNN